MDDGDSEIKPSTDSNVDELEPTDKPPFEKEKFDANVGVSETDDPEKYIQKLVGKLGQSLRSYSEENGVDLELEKYAINSLISATHTSQMDSEDQKDVINKIKNSGSDDKVENNSIDNSEVKITNELNESTIKKFSDEFIKSYIEKITPEKEDIPTYFINTLIKDREFILKNIKIKDILKTDGDFLEYYNNYEEDRYSDDEIPSYFNIYNPIVIVDGELIDGWNRTTVLSKDYDEDDIEAYVALPIDNNINEVEYKGENVKLNKPKRGGSKKFYVYTKNKEGNVIKVSFGAKNGGGNLSVKINDPDSRENFSKRHNCKDKNDKTKPGYWACRLPRYAKDLGLSGGGSYFW